MKILLDYLFPITAIEPTPAASTAFLKQVCVVAKPKSGQSGNVGNIYSCTSMTDVAARTDNTEAQQLFNAGMGKVYILLSNDLNLAAAMDANQNTFFTVLVSNDFGDADITASGASAVAAHLTKGDLTFTAKVAGTGGNSITITLADTVEAGEEVCHVSTNAITIEMDAGESTAQQIANAINDSVAASALISVAIASGQESTAQSAQTVANLASGAAATGAGLAVGTFKGVTGVASTSTSFCATQAAIERRCAFFKKSSNGSKNMFYAFGKLLSNALDWKNQQYVTMPYSDDVATVGDAGARFDDRVSFVISDDEFSNRLALFVCGGKAIAAPYIERNLQIDMQSKALNYISANEPGYTKTQAALLEDELQKVVNQYILSAWIDAGTVEIKLEQDNFVASGDINIAEPKALWRIFGEMRQNL